MLGLGRLARISIHGDPEGKVALAHVAGAGGSCFSAGFRNARTCCQKIGFSTVSPGGFSTVSPTDGFSICGPAAPDLRNGMDSDRLDRLDSDLDRLDSDLRLTSFETIAIAQAIAIPIATARYGRGIYTNSRAAGAAPGVLLRGTGRRSRTGTNHRDQRIQAVCV